jgi:hypothetical protein
MTSPGGGGPAAMSEDPFDSKSIAKEEIRAAAKGPPPSPVEYEARITVSTSLVAPENEKNWPSIVDEYSGAPGAGTPWVPTGHATKGTVGSPSEYVGSLTVSND